MKEKNLMLLGANPAIGTLVMRFPTSGVLERLMGNIGVWCQVVVNQSITPPQHRPYKVVRLTVLPLYDVKLIAA